MLEEYVPFFRQEHKKRGKIFLHLYTLLVVLTGFVFFRADTMSQAFFWIRQMVCGFHFEASCMRLLWSLLTPAGLLTFAVGIAGSLPLKKYLENRKGWQPLTMVLSLVILVLCLLNLSGGTYNPFIYFRF
ncbi:MAG: MBOAT family protein, partial [Clostridia bacterium]|nr:MBOAT family protein [Clostridia bacterium]